MEKAELLLKKLCLNEDFADVIFIVEQERVPAHRNILAASSEYFRALLYGDFAESEKKEVELDANLEAFKFLLRCIYTGCSDLSDLEVDFIIDVLKVANEYGYRNLVSKIDDNLITILDNKNLGVIMNNAHLYELQNVYNRALKHVEDHTFLVIESKSFYSFSKEVIFDIIGRDSFSDYELDIFKAVMRWGEAQTAEDLKFVLSNVRFTLMQISELRDYVAPTGVFTSEEIDEMIEDIKTVKSLPFRNYKTHRNQTDCSTNARETEFGFVFLSGRNTLFELPKEKWVNHCCIEFKTPNSFGTGYYLEVSRDKREWTRVIDFSGLVCFGMQNLYFDACVVRYIYVKLENGRKIEKIGVDIDYYTFPPTIEKGVPALTYFHQSKIEFLFNPKANVLEIRFSQPQYVNCMTTANSFIGSEMPILWTSPNSKIYKEIDCQRDPYDKCFFFDAHVVNAVKIEFNSLFTENLNNTSIRFFFNTTKPSSIGTK